MPHSQPYTSILHLHQIKHTFSKKKQGGCSHHPFLFSRMGRIQHKVAHCAPTSSPQSKSLQSCTIFLCIPQQKSLERSLVQLFSGQPQCQQHCTRGKGQTASTPIPSKGAALLLGADRPVVQRMATPWPSHPCSWRRKGDPPPLLLFCCNGRYFLQCSQRSLKNSQI